MIQNHSAIRFSNKLKPLHSIGKIRNSSMDLSMQLQNIRKSNNMSTNTPKIYSPPKNPQDQQTQCSRIFLNRKSVSFRQSNGFTSNSQRLHPITHRNSDKAKQLHSPFTKQSQVQCIIKQDPNKNIAPDFMIGTIKKTNKIQLPSKHKIIDNNSQLPSIQKINKNIKLFRDTTKSQTFQTQTNFSLQRGSNTSDLQINNFKDPNYQSSLNYHPKKQFINMPLFKYQCTQKQYNDDPKESYIKVDDRKKNLAEKREHKKMQQSRYRYSFDNISIQTPQKSYQPSPQQFFAPLKMIQQKGQTIEDNRLPKKQQTLKKKLSYSQTLDNPESIVIGMHTPVSEIKRLLIQNQQFIDIAYKIPESFMRPLDPTSTQKFLQQLMTDVFAYAGIKLQIVSIFKYSNCVIMKSKGTCILWHFNGKVYFGGWKSDSSGQGKKDGVGIQLIPQRYVYYGQFVDGRKQGYGIMKKTNKQTYIGEWRNNHRHGRGKLFDIEGKLIQNGQFQQGKFCKQGYLH